MPLRQLLRVARQHNVLLSTRTADSSVIIRRTSLRLGPLRIGQAQQGAVVDGAVPWRAAN